MKIKNVIIPNNLFLAPMAGVTDAAFREICKEFGAGLTCTEMVSIKGLLYKNKKTQSLLRTAPGEHPSCVQIFGHEPDVFKKVIESGVLDKFDIIDINMGCPAPKIVKNGDGSALMKDFALAREIIKACVAAAKQPITVKFRMGYNAGEDIAVEFAKMCEESGAAAVAIHARTRSQFYAGRADYDVIKRVKQAVKIPVIGNGDVVDLQSYNKMLQTGCDGVMLGRGALGNPEIFSILQGRKVKTSKLDIIKKHLNLLEKYLEEERENYKNTQKYYPLKEIDIVKAFRMHLLWYIKDFKNAARLRVELMKCTKIEEIMQKLCSV